MIMHIMWGTVGALAGSVATLTGLVIYINRRPHTERPRAANRNYRERSTN